MVKKRKTAGVERSRAPTYLSKARQFAVEARAALEAERHDAALLGAVHAVISGGDAVVVAFVGRRSLDPDHQRAVEYLEEVVGAGGSVRPHLRQARMLLAKKNVVEYESRRATAREAAEAVARAERFLDWAEELVRSARV